MNRLPAVNVSAALVFRAAAEVFDVPERAIRNFASPRRDAVMARDACAWVLDQLVDDTDSARARLMGAKADGWMRAAVERAGRYRDEDAEFRLRLDGLLAAVFGLGRLKLAGCIAGVDTAAEARRIAIDPLRAIKAAPVTTLAAIVEDYADTLDVLDLIRAWLTSDDVQERDAFRLGVLDALGLDETDVAPSGSREAA